MKFNQLVMFLYSDYISLMFVKIIQLIQIIEEVGVVLSISHYRIENTMIIFIVP